MKRFHPSPPGAVGFFIGDASGAAGWEVRKPDGSKEKYYIDLPSDIAQVDMALPGAPGGDKLSAPELVAKYLEKIEQIVAEARQRFTQSR